MINTRALRLFDEATRFAPDWNLVTKEIGGAKILDAGIGTPGSLKAGLFLARLCMSDLADISVVPMASEKFVVGNGVYARTDSPLVSCLGSQYAGWPVQADDFFAMGSGPMRMNRGREEVLKELELTESAESIVGVMESDKLPTESAVALIAKDCEVDAKNVHLAIAPSTSIAGSLQVVARSIETAMHKLHELKFDVRRVISATGVAPLSPPAKPGDMVAGIGRTNDAILYGAHVSMWVDCDDDQISEVYEQVPSASSSDYGRPFADIFKDYEYDFYRVDPMLFSPAVVTFHNLNSGRSWTSGSIATDILRKSFQL